MELENQRREKKLQHNVKHNKQPHANTVLLVQVNTVSLIWPFLILGCVGSAKGLVHHVNYLV